MKNYFTWTVLVLLTVSISLNLMSFSSSTSQDSTADEHILVEIYEVPAYSDKGIHIHYGGNKTELIPFHDFEKENHSKNGDLIIETINRLEHEGYDLTHVSSGLAVNGMITKIWMVKRK